VGRPGGKERATRRHGGGRGRRAGMRQRVSTSLRRSGCSASGGNCRGASCHGLRGQPRADHTGRNAEARAVQGVLAGRLGDERPRLFSRCVILLAKGSTTLVSFAVTLRCVRAAGRGRTAGAVASLVPARRKIGATVATAPSCAVRSLIPPPRRRTMVRRSKSRGTGSVQRDV